MTAYRAGCGALVSSAVLMVSMGPLAHGEEPATVLSLVVQTECGVRVKMTPQTTKTELSADGSKYVEHEGKAGKVSLQMSCVPLSVPIEDAKRIVLESILAPGASLTSERSLTLGGHPGYEFTVTRMGGGVRARVYSLPRGMLSMNVGGVATALNDPVPNAFLDSAELTN